MKIITCWYECFNNVLLLGFCDFKKTKEGIKKRINVDIFFINNVESMYVLEIKKGTIKKGKISKAKFKADYYFIRSNLFEFWLLFRYPGQTFSLQVPSLKVA